MSHFHNVASFCSCRDYSLCYLVPGEKRTFCHIFGCLLWTISCDCDQMRSWSLLHWLRALKSSTNSYLWPDPACCETDGRRPAFLRGRSQGPSAASRKAALWACGEDACCGCCPDLGSWYWWGSGQLFPFSMHLFLTIFCLLGSRWCAAGICRVFCRVFQVSSSQMHATAHAIP